MKLRVGKAILTVTRNRLFGLTVESGNATRTIHNEKGVSVSYTNALYNVYYSPDRVKV